MTSIHTAVITLCVALGLEGCCCKPENQQRKTAPEEPAVAAPAPEPAIPGVPPGRTDKLDALVSAKDLFKEYEANEVRADEKYKGKRVGVVGRVDSIDKDFMGDIVLKLQTGDRFSTVHAGILGSQKSKAMDLSKGDIVQLACFGGTRIMHSPTLRKCFFITKEMVEASKAREGT